eukprot:1479028-Amphidinium_carterae.1
MRERRNTIQKHGSIPDREKPLHQVYVPVEGAYGREENDELYQDTVKAEESIEGKPCIIFDNFWAFFLGF